MVRAGGQGRGRAQIAQAVRFALVAGFGSKLADAPAGLDCATASRTAPPGIVVNVCQPEYEKTLDPPTGIKLADALRRSGNLDRAAAIAHGLLTSRVRADALLLLGKVAVAQDRSDEAVELLESARTLHRSAADHAGLALDDQALAGVLVSREQSAEALSLLDECITEARLASKAVTEGYCHLSAGKVLSEVGYFELAHQELDRAQPLLRQDRDLATLEYERGNLDQEVARIPLHAGNDAQAIVAFERALVYAARSQRTDLTLSIELNLAYSLAEVGRLDDAERHLEAATTLDVEHDHEPVRAHLAGRIAYRRGNLTLASSLIERAYSNNIEDTDRLDIAALRARIALAENDFDHAEQWARRGVEQAEKIRTAQSALELRPWVLSTRREPYELLFVALARAGRARDALLAFDHWQGRTLLDAMARPSSLSSLDLRGVATRVERLGNWLPIVSAAPIANIDSQALLQTLQIVDVLALVVADGDVWCITSSSGDVHLHDLGPVLALQGRIDRFMATPTDHTLGDELGALILQDHAFRTTHEPLHVLLDGPLAGLPVAALRRDNRPLIAVRPMVRAPRLPEAACVAPRRSKQAIVIADAVGDLPAARDEAAEVAALLSTTSATGDRATRKALFAATGDSVLHLAVHAGSDAGGAFLELHDQAVSALEIAAHKLGPSLVVLSACGSARSNDTELAGSLATAYLAAGSPHVVATLRPISDAGAREIATRFYRAGGVADPVRTLAEVQSALATTANTDWPSFAVFGHDICARP